MAGIGGLNKDSMAHGKKEMDEELEKAIELIKLKDSFQDLTTWC